MEQNHTESLSPRDRLAIHYAAEMAQHHPDGCDSWALWNLSEAFKAGWDAMEAHYLRTHNSALRTPSTPPPAGLPPAANNTHKPTHP